MTGAHPVHVLVVDDEPALRRTLERALRLLGYDVTTAADAESAYELVGERTFDAVVVDVQMPQMRGDTLCLALMRRNPELRDRLILMTGDPWVAEHGWPAELRACPLLAKPFGLDVLARAVRAVLDAHRVEPRRGNGHG